MDIEDKKYQQMRRRILKRKYQVASNQARYRRQEWELDEQQYFDLWESIPQSWLFSGQGAEDYNLSRKDMTGSWCVDNVAVIPRRQMLANQGRYISENNKKSNPQKAKQMTTKFNPTDEQIRNVVDAMIHQSNELDTRTAQGKLNQIRNSTLRQHWESLQRAVAQNEITQLQALESHKQLKGNG